MFEGGSVRIGDRIIGQGNPVFVIAEAGVNHNGRFDLAWKLVDAAAEAGADAIKFQTWQANQLVTPQGKMAGYQIKNTGKEESQLEMLRKLEFSEDWYPKIMAYAKERGLIFLSTSHGGFEAVDLLESFGAPAFKFGSGDLNNLPLLEHAAQYQKPMLISTGMSTMEEIREAVLVIQKIGNNQIVIFHCTTNYPCFPHEINLSVIKTFLKEFGSSGAVIGYSDHTIGIQVPVMAASLGAAVIEKHITLDNRMEGPDHVASAEPALFKEMVESLKRAPVILGSPEKKLIDCEIQYIKVARKSLVAGRNIKKGEKLTKENIAIKRPGDGMEPKRFYEVLGKVASVDISKDTILGAEHFA